MAVPGGGFPALGGGGGYPNQILGQGNSSASCVPPCEPYARDTSRTCWLKDCTPPGVIPGPNSPPPTMVQCCRTSTKLLYRLKPGCEGECPAPLTIATGPVQCAPCPQQLLPSQTSTTA